MAEADGANAKRWKRAALTVALVVATLAAAHVVGFMILADLSWALYGLIPVGLAFLVGVIVVLIGFAANMAYCPSNWRAHVPALAIFLGIFCFYFFTGRFG